MNSNSADASLGGDSMVSATAQVRSKGSSLGMREGRVLSCRSPSTPSAANRFRQTQVLDVLVSRMIGLAPAPSALSKTICARQTCFYGAFRPLTRDGSDQR